MKQSGIPAGRQTRREYISSMWDCQTFARNVLHISIDAKGRAKSLDGQEGAGNLALSISPEVWYDHKKQVGGGVVELCAWGMFDGDIGRAMEYLCGDFYDVDATEWRRETDRIRRLCQEWHTALKPEDREYLHSRRITDETIDRLQIGSVMSSGQGLPDHRLSIPYFQNGRIVYYISRDRTGIQGAQKYRKGYLPKSKDGKDKEVLQNIPWGLHTLARRNKSAQMSIVESDIKKSEWLIICEGAFDAMSFEQEGYCVLATMGGVFSPSVLRQVFGWCKEFSKVLVIFDNDSAGQKFTQSMSKSLFAERVNFFVGLVPISFGGITCKDVSDYYTAGGELSELVKNAVRGVEYLADMYTEPDDVKSLLFSVGRQAEKTAVLELWQRLRGRKIFSPLWLKTLYDEAVKAPAETRIVSELGDKYNLKYIENTGFFEYRHGVWIKTPDNRIKGYADKLLGRHATNARMTGAMKFAQARFSTDDVMNTQPVINMQNGAILIDDDCRFVQHDPSYLSTIQIPYYFVRGADCPLWRGFINEIMEGDRYKVALLQEIGGYPLWPDNSLEKCFFLIGDGGNGKGVFMDMLRDVYGRENCSALPLSSFGSNFDAIMLQYSLVNFASETRVDLRGNIERIKEVTSGNDIVAAHKGVDAIKFSPRCKLITSCNDFFNTGDITHALMRRMCFVRFGRNYVQMKKADPLLKQKLSKELPGILNWCIEGYLRLLERTKNPNEKDKFTPTQEDAEIKREFMKTTNPVAFFIEERLMDVSDAYMSLREIYREFKTWADDSGYKALSLGAFTNRIKRVMKELRPEVSLDGTGKMESFMFPPAADDDSEAERM